jgi:hypothetical protein
MRLFHVVLSKIGSCLFDVYFKNTKCGHIEKICKLAPDVGFGPLAVIPNGQLDMSPVTAMLKEHRPGANTPEDTLKLRNPRVNKRNFPIEINDIDFCRNIPSIPAQKTQVDSARIGTDLRQRFREPDFTP